MANPRPNKRFRWASDVTGGDFGPRALAGSANVPPAKQPSGLGFALDYFKRAQTDRFAEWRRGNYAWKPEERQAEIDIIAHPKPGSWDPWDLADQNAGFAADFFVAGEGPNVPLTVDEGQIGSVESRTAMEMLTGLLGEIGFGKVKLLGIEDGHLQYQFSMQDAQRHSFDIVIKVDVTKGQTIGLAKEKAIMQRMRGSAHIQQQLQLQFMPNSFDPARPLAGNGESTSWAQMQMRGSRKDFDSDTDIVIMKYWKHGDLGMWLERFSALNAGKPLSMRERPPEKVLWSIFLCLWHGVVAMSYPGRQANPTSVLNPNASAIPLRNEWLPEGGRRERLPQDPMVHFDLRPSNVSVTDFDGLEGHELFPMLQISKFTQAAFPLTDIRNLGDAQVERYLWSLRERGQADSFLPEQTAEAWDYLPDLDALRTSVVAGNYGPQSNIFHIGLIMWQLITCCKPEKPFMARPYSIPSTSKEGTGVILTGWTCGHSLLSRYQNWTVDDRGTVWPSERLRNLVARCMEYIPSRRLALAKLGVQIKITLRDLAEGAPPPDDEFDDSAGLGDDEIRQWSEWSLASAPAQPASCLPEDSGLLPGDPMELDG